MSRAARAHPLHPRPPNVGQVRELHKPPFPAIFVSLRSPSLGLTPGHPHFFSGSPERRSRPHRSSCSSPRVAVRVERKKTACVPLRSCMGRWMGWLLRCTASLGQIRPNLVFFGRSIYLFYSLLKSQCRFNYFVVDLCVQLFWYNICSLPVCFLKHATLAVCKNVFLIVVLIKSCKKYLFQ